MEVFQWSNIKLGDRVVSQVGHKNVIIHNVNNNKTVKITKEAYDVINEICKYKWNIGDVLNKCETHEDRRYLLDNLIYLAENSIIRDINDFSEYKDIDIKLDWDITNKCNLRCKHCCVCADIEHQDLDKEAIFEIVDKIVLLNPVAITISGGEPLIRKDFKDIISRLRLNYHGDICLMTNATLVDDELANFISNNFSSVSVSIDGVDEETCSLVRGKGVFEKTIQGIKRLQNAGMTQISASMLVSTATYKYKRRFFDMCNEMKVHPFLRGLSLIGRAKEEMRDMVPDRNEQLNYEREQLNYERQETLSKKPKELGKIPLFSCGAAFKQFQIDYRGNIYPCQSLMEEELLLGNVFDIDNLNTYIRNRSFVNSDGYKTLEQFFPYNFVECKGCNKQIFCWSCIESIYREKKKRENCSNSCVWDRYWE